MRTYAHIAAEAPPPAPVTGLPHSMARPFHQASYYPGNAGQLSNRNGTGMHGPAATQGTRGVDAPVAHAPAPAGATSVPEQAPQSPVAGSSNVALLQYTRAPTPPLAGPSAIPEPPPANPSPTQDAGRILDPFEEAVERRRTWNPEADMFVGHCWYGYMGEDGFIHPFCPPRPCDGQCEHHRVLKKGLGGH